MSYADSGDYSYPIGSDTPAPLVDDITSLEPARLADPQDGCGAGKPEPDCRTIDQKLRAEIAAALAPIYGQLSRIEAMLDGTTLRGQYTK